MLAILTAVLSGCQKNACSESAEGVFASASILQYLQQKDPQTVSYTLPDAGLSEEYYAVRRAITAVQEYLAIHDNEFCKNFAGVFNGQDRVIVLSTEINDDISALMKEICRDVPFELVEAVYTDAYLCGILGAINPKLSALYQQKKDGTLPVELVEMMDVYPICEYYEKDNRVTVSFALAENDERFEKAIASFEQYFGHYEGVCFVADPEWKEAEFCSTNIKGGNEIFAYSENGTLISNSSAGYRADWDD